MAFTPPVYSDTLTKKHWDKKKSLLGKAAGSTGVGDAAKAANEAYDKIEWKKSFDVLNNGSLSTLVNAPDAKETIEKAIKGVTLNWNKTVKPVIDALHTLDTTAKAAAGGKLAKHKSDAALATQMAKDARWLIGGLQTNGIFFTDVYKKCQDALDGIDKARAEFKKTVSETKTFLTTLLTGLAKVKANIDDPQDIWESDVKQAGRSVCNNLKSSPDLAKKHLKTWLTKFKGFDYSTLGYADLDPDKRKAAILALIKEVQVESTELLKDLA